MDISFDIWEINHILTIKTIVNYELQTAIADTAHVCSIVASVVSLTTTFPGGGRVTSSHNKVCEFLRRSSPTKPR
jgi:hypothetical protein